LNIFGALALAFRPMVFAPFGVAAGYQLHTETVENSLVPTILRRCSGHESDGSEEGDSNSDELHYDEAMRVAGNKERQVDKGS
jgi:hypothetical protein